MHNEMIDNGLLKNIKFKAAIYCRLSREDEGRSESESIKNQKDFLLKYLSEKDWELADIYTDDGFTGTNFDRPDFQRLVSDIENGKVNLVITKDLSRLGRDYITTGHYLEKYFPEKKIRYIAVNDGIDTFENMNSHDFTPFRSVINDMYARDISVKVRSAMDSKRKSGKFIGAFAPYGYKKDPEDRNKLIIDDETASVVKRIFSLYLNGCGLTEIAHMLNNEGIMTPSLWKESFSNFRSTSSVPLWNHSTIKSILKNPTYMGCLTQHKYKKINYKSKKLVTLPKDSWIVVENTHDPIIDKKIFQDVQKLLERNNQDQFSCRKHPRLFSGYVFCGDCGAYMTTAKTCAKTYLVCSTYKRYTSQYCARHSFAEDALEKLVIRDLKAYVKEVVSRSKFMEKVGRKSVIRPEQQLQQEMKRIESRMEEIQRVIKNLYSDKVKGIVGEETFVELNQAFNKEKSILNARLEALTKKIEGHNGHHSENEAICELVDEVLGVKKLDRHMLEKLIKKIEIFEKQKIKIYYNFKNPFEKVT